LRKPLIIALTGILVLAIAGTAQAQFSQQADISFTKPKANTSTGIKTNLVARDPSAPNGKPKAATNVVVTFPKGTKYDPSALPACKGTDTEIGQTGCPSNTQVGTGVAHANAAPVLADAVENIKAYNGTGGAIIFQLTGVQSFVLRGKISGNKLTTPVPPFCAISSGAGCTVTAVLTDFALNTKAIKKSGHAYLTTPKTCPSNKTYQTVTKFTYEDGSSLSVKAPPQKCSP
jgi:hypothetical protein